ncbi:cation-transporting atpase plant, putative [Ricinus communis]|uniref:Calcium-transporting ATPase n=1 Tax=Ricinus communis TaxID=3988 RepID=B9SGZ9_RICCO|nr:cation-transporting atpase plant, putative [Ricinus communis]
MEAYLNENFGNVKSKNSTEEDLCQWRKVSGVVRNPKRRFRFTANLSKRYEAAAMRRTNQEKLRIAVLVSKAAFQYIQGLSPSEYTAPEEVEAAGFKICADELVSIVEGLDVKKLKFHGGVNGIAEKLSTSVVDGLYTDNDLLNIRQKIYEYNKLTERQASSFWIFVWEALQDKILIIDSICAFVSLIVGIVIEGWQKRACDAVAVVASIFLVVFITAVNDYWQSSQFRDWEKEKKKLVVQVTRNGFRQRVWLEDLLPGDIVHLTSGDQVPADGLFVSGFSVLIDESSVVGERELVTVNSENPYMLSGTKVQEGSCKMLVTTVGMRTQWGKLMATINEGGDDETPLQVKLNGVAAIIGKVGLYFALTTFAVLLQRMLTRKFQEATHWSWSGYDALEMFKYFTISFTIFIIAVPEGLALAVTLNLAFAMKKMIKDKALVRHLAACETMGSATTICADKSGILTTNYMILTKICICMDVRHSIFNNTSSAVVFNEYGKLEVLGTPTEKALLDFGLSLAGDFHKERQRNKLVKVESFNSAKKRMGVILRLPDGGLQAHCKGAPEIILAACDKVMNSEGEIVALDEASAKHLKVTVDQFANEALRILCLAYMELGEGFSDGNPIPDFGYTLIAIVGMKDPIRPGVKESIAVCRSAGITVRMVTGDNLNAAEVIAKECGILTEDGITIEGPDFREKTQGELLQLIPRIQVLARSSPLDKHELVKHLRTTFNEVVAVTGDGINDASSLLEADVGVAMGSSGTDVAKESADIIILDDNFSSVVTMIKWGRSVVMNIKSFVQFQLTATIVALILNITSACLTGNAPFSDLELLWVGLVTDTLVAFAFATEPPHNDMMKRLPVGRKGSLITNAMWRNILGQCFYQFMVIWYLQAKGKAILHLDDGQDSDLILDTFIFNSFIFCQVSNLISSRKMEEINVFQGILNNYVLVVIVCCIVLFQIAIVEFLGAIANTSPLTLSQWFFSAFIGLLGMPIAAGVKMIPIVHARQQSSSVF